MPAQDNIHEAVKNALVRDGWVITDDPFTIVFLEARLFADLAAEHPLRIRRGERKLVVEAKSFLSASGMQDFKLALGQFLLYRAFLEVIAADHELYLAVATTAFEEVFRFKAIDFVLRRYHVPVLVADTEKQEITQWINPHDTES